MRRVVESIESQDRLQCEEACAAINARSRSSRRTCATAIACNIGYKEQLQACGRRYRTTLGSRIDVSHLQRRRQSTFFAVNVVIGHSGFRVRQDHGVEREVESLARAHGVAVTWSRKQAWFVLWSRRVTAAFGPSSNVTRSRYNIVLERGSIRSLGAALVRNLALRIRPAGHNIGRRRHP